MRKSRLTPMEQLFREAAGRVMNLAERHYFLKKRKHKSKPRR